jgi:hypothetical protein
MVIIDNVAALEAVADPSLRPILNRYRDMMDLATLYIIEPSDTLASLSDKRGRSFAGWEFISAFPGGWYCAVIVTCDDGAGDVILVPDRADIDPELLCLCRDNAESASDNMI